MLSEQYIGLLLGLSSFFVSNEPAFVDYIMLMIMLGGIKVIYKRVLMSPVLFLLAIAHIVGLLLEWFWFDSIRWMLVSCYLYGFALSFKLSDPKCFFDSLALGGFIGACITLLSVVIWPDNVVFDDVRVVGYFKDPNVLAPTAGVFAIISIQQKKILPFLVLFLTFIAANSRASIGAFVLSLLMQFPVVFMVLLFLFLFYGIDLIEKYGDLFFGYLGRGRVINPYDHDRFSNWVELIDVWSKSLVPLGPNYSNVMGYAAHNTYLRLMVEQGVLVLLSFVGLFFLLYKISRGFPFLRISLAFLLFNAFFVDATHWRILFFLVGIMLSLGFDKAGVVRYDMSIDKVNGWSLL